MKINKHEAHADNYLDSLDYLSESMGDRITLNQALEIADKMEEATLKILDRATENDGDTIYEMSVYQDILDEVLGK